MKMRAQIAFLVFISNSLNRSCEVSKYLININLAIYLLYTTLRRIRPTFGPSNAIIAVTISSNR